MGKSPSEEIDEIIDEVGGWRGDKLSSLRRLIKRADPDIVEEIKWRKPSNSMRGVPVWSHDGIMCTGETYKNKVKLTFAHGASLRDPKSLFNSSLGRGTRRAIDLDEIHDVDEEAFMALVQEAVAWNESSTRY